MSEQQKTTGQVAQDAKRQGVENTSQMDKEEMIEAMRGGGDNPSAPGHGGGQGDSPQPKGTSPDDWKDVPGNQS